MYLPFSLFAIALLPHYVEAYSYGDDDYYEEYENVVIAGAPDAFEYVYERKLAYEYGVEEVYLHLYYNIYNYCNILI
jgi:hypothetical protein